MKSSGGSPRLCKRTVLFKSKEEAGEDEHGDGDHQHDDPQFLPSLVQGVKDTLQPHEMTDHLENAEDPHHSDLRWNLRDFFADQTDHGAGLADDLHVMQPWGRRCNGDVKGRLPERMIEM